jgi:hypothetical protein
VARDSFRHAAEQKMREPAAAVRRAGDQVNVSAAREVGYLAHWRSDAHFGARAYFGGHAITQQPTRATTPIVCRLGDLRAVRATEPLRQALPLRQLGCAHVHTGPCPKLGRSKQVELDVK